MKARIVDRPSSYPGESLVLVLEAQEEDERGRLRSWMSPSPLEQYELRIRNVLLRTNGPSETQGFMGVEVGFARKEPQPISVEVKLDATEFIEEIRGVIAEVARLRRNRLASYLRHLWRDLALVARTYVALRSHVDPALRSASYGLARDLAAKEIREAGRIEVPTESRAPGPENPA